LNFHFSHRSVSEQLLFFRCEPFPTYPRTYDLVHADNLLSLQTSQPRKTCLLIDIFTEIDRLLRPEVHICLLWKEHYCFLYSGSYNKQNFVQGWVIIRDTAQLVEKARETITQLKWEARVIEVESSSEQRLLICQKPFTKRQSI